MCSLVYLHNSTWTFDDPGLIGRFMEMRRLGTVFSSLPMIFFGSDLPAEYRLYGVSRTLHLLVSLVFADRSWGYAALIFTSQLLTARGIYLLCRRLGTDGPQAYATCFAWFFSPFAVTYCFHHYSYLVLPVQLTVAAALVLNRLVSAPNKVSRLKERLLFIALSLGVAWTGESHLMLSATLLGVTAFLSVSPRSMQNRAKEFGIFGITLIFAVSIHRFTWTYMTAGSGTVRPRFNLSVAGTTVLAERGSHFLWSIPKGMINQLEAITTFSGSIQCLLLWACCLLLLYSQKRKSLHLHSRIDDPNTGWVLASFLFILSFLPLLLPGAVSIISNQINEVLPRRYGFVPFTLVLMAICAFCAAPGTRRKLGLWPGLFSLSAVIASWMALQLFALPKIRSEDQQVWSKIEAALKVTNGKSIVFMTQWNSPFSPRFHMDGATPGFRNGLGFPDVFESSLVSFWMEETHARLLGARLVGYSVVQSPVPGIVRVYVGEPTAQRFVEVSAGSIVIAVDRGFRPPAVASGFDDVSIYTDYSDYRKAIMAPIDSAAQLVPVNFIPPSVNELTIGSGFPFDQGLSSWMLADKKFDQKAIHVYPILNHGFESGDDQSHTPEQPGGFTYLSTNRHGAFTYRIDLADALPRVLLLDFMDQWHDAPNVRPIQIAICRDGIWSPPQLIDPAGVAGFCPLSYGIPIANQSIRIRVDSPHGATDIPFINGMRFLSQDQITKEKQ